MEFHKKHRHEPTEPQLAAMIDVFSILIIFLIAGTVMSNTSVIVPNGVNPPRSISKEDLVTAPQLTIAEGKVILGFDEIPYPLSSFTESNSNDNEIIRFKEAIKQQVKKTEGKTDSGLVNFVTDQNTKYENIFNVIRIAREAGFKSILFVATAGVSK